MQRLLRATMRLRPDRIIVGEVRSGEALSLLKAWRTGHPGGVCTVHDDHARAGPRRLEQVNAEVSRTPMRALIAEAVNLIVSVVRTDQAPGRRIDDVVAVTGFVSRAMEAYAHLALFYLPTEKRSPQKLASKISSATAGQPRAQVSA
jgi:type IV secretion system protein VirB11